MLTDQEAEISEGEIIDDEAEESEPKKDPIQIKFSVEKLQKNFRKSNQNDSEGEEVNITKSMCYFIYAKACKPNFCFIEKITHRREKLSIDPVTEKLDTLIRGDDSTSIKENHLLMSVEGLILMQNKIFAKDPIFVEVINKVMNVVK